MSKNDTLKVGIIGSGAIGTVHANAYIATGECKITCISDINPKALETLGEKINVSERFENYKELLKTDVDAVSVCVGNAMHKQVAIDALKAGKHILLEKPMAMNSVEARKIAAAAAESKGLCQMGMTRRQHPAAQLLREYITNGDLGAIHHMRCVMVRRRGIPGLGRWFTTIAESGGGPMIDLGVHWFDMAMWLSDQWKPTAVSAKTYAKFGKDMKNYKYVWMWAGPPNYKGVCDVEDYATGFVRFGEKATMSFEIAWAANAKDESYVEIQGDKGGARLFEEQGLKIYTENNGRVADIVPHFDGNDKAFDVQAKKFLAACRGEIKPVATAEQGVAVMKLIDAIYASSKQNKEVVLR
jgi:predicted dehydrogenase